MEGPSARSSRRRALSTAAADGRGKGGRCSTRGSCSTESRSPPSRRGGYALPPVRRNAALLRRCSPPRPASPRWRCSSTCASRPAIARAFRDYGTAHARGAPALALSPWFLPGAIGFAALASALGASALPLRRSRRAFLIGARALVVRRARSSSRCGRRSCRSSSRLTRLAPLCALRSPAATPVGSCLRCALALRERRAPGARLRRRRRRLGGERDGVAGCDVSGARLALHLVRGLVRRPARARASGQDALPDDHLRPARRAPAPARAAPTCSRSGAAARSSFGFGGNAIVDGDGRRLHRLRERRSCVGGDPRPSFTELGEVSVSDDGETWTTFPCKQDGVPVHRVRRLAPGALQPRRTAISPFDPARGRRRRLRSRRRRPRAAPASCGSATSPTTARAPNAGLRSRRRGHRSTRARPEPFAAGATCPRTTFGRRALAPI